MLDYLEIYSNKVRTVYSALQDDLSRGLFECRFLFQLTGDAKHLINMHNTGNGGAKNTIYDLIAATRIISAKVVMYGSGRRGVKLYSILKSMNINITHFCDTDTTKIGTEYLGFPVISPEELVRSHKDKYVFISSAYYTDEIYENLRRIGFPMERVYVQGYYKEQYFGEDFLRPLENEIYVDAGCYSGDTIKRFIKFSGNSYRKIYGLEPSNENYKTLSEAFSTEERIILGKKGAWSCETVQLFEESAADSTISSGGTDVIEMTTIDAMVDDDAVTLIKMDVEGAELEALKGARKTIIQNKPRLAISIYHKPEDILMIPLYIHELVPEYVFYIRHHAPYPSFSETILYAVIK